MSVERRHLMGRRRNDVRYALMMLVALIATYGAWQSYTTAAGVSQDQRSTTRALCALRGELQTRVIAGDMFLRAHPQGIPGISARVIESSLSGERQTIRALRFIACQEGVS